MTSPLASQQIFHATSRATVIAGNTVVGGVTAAVQAFAAHRPVGKAFVAGALGGTIHGSGKALQPRIGYGAMAVGALGTSMVANAGRGMTPLEEVVLPIGVARVRLTRGQEPHLSASVNAFESATVVRRLMRAGVHMDWARSAQSGTFVLRTADPLFGLGRRATGLTSASVMLLTDRAQNSGETFDHEQIHVQQEWFLQEIWGRPMELAVRRRVPGLRRFPQWIEIGGMPTALLALEIQAVGARGPLRSWLEVEAESFVRRPW